MRKLVNRLLALTAAVFVAAPALAQEGEISAQVPSTEDSSIRLIPVLGVSSFTATRTPDLQNFNGDPSIGLLVGFGKGGVTWEVGALALQADVERPAEGTLTTRVDSWGIPLMASVNLFNRPNWHLFGKLGVMPLTTREADGFDISGRGAIGGNFEVTENLDIMVEAAYSQLFNNGGDLGDFSGVSLLTGLVFEL